MTTSGHDPELGNDVGGDRALAKYDSFFDSFWGGMTGQVRDRLEFALRGLEEAIGRLETTDAARDPDAAGLRTGEALLWFSAAHDLIGAPRDAELLFGLRYVRDRVIHEAAHTCVTDVITAGGYGVTSYGLGSYGVGSSMTALRWQSREEMPPPPDRFDDPAKSAAYDEHIAGRDVRRVLKQVLAELLDVARRGD